MKRLLEMLIAKGKLTEALELMIQISDTQNNDFRTMTILLSGQNAGNENDKSKNILDEAIYNRSKAKISDAILRLLQMEFDDSKAPTPSQSQIEQVSNKAPNTEGGSKPKVYFSYAWGDDKEEGESREKIVQDLYDSLKNAAFDVRRDKENIGYRNSIRDFMQELGKGDCIIVAISDKYLKSENCMFEMYEIYRNAQLEKDDFYDKIFPIRAESVKLSDPEVLMTYFQHWEEKEKKWEKLIMTFGTRVTSEQQDQYRRVKEIAHELGDFLAFLNDINAKSKKDLSKDDFEEIKKAILEKVSN